VRLHLLSDLHLEFGPFALPRADADVVVLAGDIAHGTAGVELARRWAGERPTIFVAGNHEYYRRRLPGLNEELRAAARGSPVRVLENDETVIGGVRFLGCTLWSDFEAAGADEAAAAMELCGMLLNDYELITWSRGDRTLVPQDTRRLHHVSRRWLAGRLAAPHAGPTVVVTHHAPIVRTRPAAPLQRALLGAFATDLSWLMDGERVALWVHGHTHRVVDVQVNGTRVVSNPRGYPHEPVSGFDPGRVVELGPAVAGA
jgi:predicted phosphodiesterase